MCVEFRAMRGFYQKTVISGVVFSFLFFCPVFPQHAMTQSKPLTKALYFKGIEKVAQPEFLEKFTQGAETVKILVLLKDHENYKGVSVADDVVLMKEVIPDIQIRQDKVLNALNHTQFQLKHRFKNILGFSGEATLQGIIGLAGMDNVTVIEEDREMEILSAETLEREKGEKGKNVSQERPHRSVPVIPNASIVTGKVLGYSILSSSRLDIKPVMPIYKLEVLVETSEELKGMRNFTRDRVQNLLSFYSKEKLSTELFSKVIKAHVTYRGDERGGKFWIREIEVLKAKQRKIP
jgi:hypothetical protein